MNIASVKNSTILFSPYHIMHNQPNIHLHLESGITG